jgi:hypothetical protein
VQARQIARAMRSLIRTTSPSHSDISLVAERTV